MFYLVLVCIKLSVIHFCTSDIIDRKCIQDPKIILLQCNNDEIIKLNEELIEKCGHIYDFEIEDYRRGVSGMLVAHKEHPHSHLINLYVHDYYNYNHIDTSEAGLAYAGDHPLSDPGQLCLVGYRNGTKEVECNVNSVKMVTDSVTEIDGGRLYNFIWNMEYKGGNINTEGTCDGYPVDNSGLNIVFICLEKDDGEFDKIKFAQQFCPLIFRFVPSQNCGDQIKKYKNKLLALVSPTPFKIDFELSAPTIFYDVPFVYKENDDMFPNSILSDWMILKYPILKLLEEMNWRKVAIISDDSPYSAEFEEELTQIFRENVIMYNVHRCLNRTSCDDFFRNVVELLNEEGVRIIIANFHNKYTERFTGSRFKWIVSYLPSHGWPRYLGSGFSVTLAPAGDDSAQYEQLGLSYLNDVHTKIVENIKHISNAYQQITRPNDKSRKEFLGNISILIRKSQESMEYVSNVTDEGSRWVACMNVTRHGANVVSLTPQPRRISDVTNCSIRSNDYFSSCNDMELILIMLVVIVFATTLLLIIVYFHKSSPLHTPSFTSF